MMFFRGLAVAVTAAMVLGSAATAAKPPRFDVTGHWVGTYLQDGDTQQGNLDFQLTAGKGTSFTGSGMAGQPGEEGQFTMTGTLAPSGKSSMKITAAQQHISVTLTGKLTGLTISGRFTEKEPGKKHAGSFTISKQLGSAT